MIYDDKGLNHDVVVLEFPPIKSLLVFKQASISSEKF